MQAVDWGPACPQPVRFTGATKGIRDMDEDCLYLNIFSPNVSIFRYLITLTTRMDAKAEVLHTPSLCGLCRSPRAYTDGQRLPIIKHFTAKYFFTNN